MLNKINWTIWGENLSEIWDDQFQPPQFKAVAQV